MTTRTEEARGLLAVALDDGRRALERKEAYWAANDIRKELKVGWPKLHPRGLPLDSASLESEIERQLAKDLADDETPRTEVLEEDPEYTTPVVSTAAEAIQILDAGGGVGIDVSTPEGKAAAAEAIAHVANSKRPRKASAPKDEHRGEISALVRSLLQSTDLPYADIVARVLAAHPAARTTARSVASVAADLRKAGGTVSLRRPEAKR